MVHRREVIDGAWLLSQDHSGIGATMNHVRVYQDNELVYDDLIPNGPYLSAYSSKDPDDCLWKAEWDNTCVEAFAAKVNEFTIVDGPSFPDGGRVIVTPADAEMAVSARTTLEMRFSQMPTVEVARGRLSKFGNAHGAKGQAMFGCSESALMVHNIGSSGEDGVGVHWEDDPDGACPTCPQDFSLRWDNLDPNDTVPVGAFVEFQATGQVGGEYDVELGSLRATRVSADRLDGPEITVDYSAIGSSTHRVVVLDDGAVVTVISGHTGPVVAQVVCDGIDWEPDPDGCGKGLAIIDDYTTACFRPWWPNDVQFNIPDGPSVVGDELRVLAENPDAEFQRLNSFSVLLADYPSMTIVEENAILPGSVIPAVSEWGVAVMVLMTMTAGSLVLRSPNKRYTGIQ